MKYFKNNNRLCTTDYIHLHIIEEQRLFFRNNLIFVYTFNSFKTIKTHIIYVKILFHRFIFVLFTFIIILVSTSAVELSLPCGGRATYIFAYPIHHCTFIHSLYIFTQSSRLVVYVTVIHIITIPYNIIIYHLSNRLTSI